jgi:hypothetical protein
MTSSDHPARRRMRSDGQTPLRGRRKVPPAQGESRRELGVAERAGKRQRAHCTPQGQRPAPACRAQRIIAAGVRNDADADGPRADDASLRPHPRGRGARGFEIREYVIRAWLVTRSYSRRATSPSKNQESRFVSKTSLEPPAAWRAGPAGTGTRHQRSSPVCRSGSTFVRYHGPWSVLGCLVAHQQRLANPE